MSNLDRIVTSEPYWIKYLSKERQEALIKKVFYKNYAYNEYDNVNPQVELLIAILEKLK